MNLPLKPILILTALAAPLAAQLPQPEEDNFRINVVEKRIVETNFSSEKAATVNTDKVRLQAGAGVNAGSIVLTIRGATGNGRFRARLNSLDWLFKRTN
ncbi:MAG: hypothetical protein JO053_08750 [Acidobacteria bacterium]|nr:hypothetical protein [Acidobacteriota bacterium]